MKKYSIIICAYNEEFRIENCLKSVIPQIINEEEVILGDKGTSLIFDGTKLLHRGGLIDEGERIVLQVIFERKVDFYYLKKIFNLLLKKIKS